MPLGSVIAFAVVVIALCGLIIGLTRDQRAQFMERRRYTKRMKAQLAARAAAPAPSFGPLRPAPVPAPPVAAAPEPVAAEPEPVAAEPEPEPVAAVTADSEPIAAEPGPEDVLSPPATLSGPAGPSPAPYGPPPAADHRGRRRGAVVLGGAAVVAGWLLRR